MLGSVSEAVGVVQEASTRRDRSDPSGVENLGGWLTTVVARRRPVNFGMQRRQLLNLRRRVRAGPTAELAEPSPSSGH
jgi:hypothetical protein